MSSDDSNSGAEHSQEFQKQVEAYIAWVNSQLKKRSGNKPVKDLRTDFKDGIVLAQLLEIISGEKIDGIIVDPKKSTERRNNISIVLQFLKSQNIQLHHITERDIMEGGIRSIMRLILTLAAHFKPASVGMKKTVSASAAVSAGAALGDLRRQVSGAGKFKDRWKKGSPQSANRRFRKSAANSPQAVSLSSSLPVESPERSKLNLEKDSSMTMSPGSCNLILSPSPPRTVARMLKMSESPAHNASVGNLEDSDDEWSGSMKEFYDDLDEELSGARKLISLLQNLLVNGTVPEKYKEDKEDGENREIIPSNVEEQVVVVQSKLDLCHHENEELKKELNKLRQEFRASSASNSALRSRIQQQEKEVTSLKQQLRKINAESEKIVRDKASLLSQLEEEQRINKKLVNDVAERNVTIKHLRKDCDYTSSQLKKLGHESKDKLMSAQKLEIQVQELSHQLQILQKYNHPARSLGDENSVINESLNSLRSNLPPRDSRHHIIDTLEQAINSLNEQPSRFRTTSDVSYPRQSEIPSPTHSPRSRRREGTLNPSGTTVIYFMDRNMTPYRATIPKKIGNITLKDFKNIIRHSASFRYNFKALDPEFGTVKKEIVRDEDTVPGWEGKIVAWLEKTGNPHRN